LSYEYLIAAYGPDKLNDFTQAEPIGKRLIEMEPSEPGNYQTLGKLYEDQGRYEEAEAHFLKAVEVRPDALGYSVLAGYYDRQGNFDKTMEAWENRAKVEPNNPEAHHTIAHWAWNKAFKDYTISTAEKRRYIERGIAAEDTALSLHADYVEALTYKNILLRMKAGMEKDRKVIDALINEADRLRNRAMELQKTQGGGGGI
jgi:tetratricopeptide (TPR) repeat protein